MFEDSVGLSLISMGEDKYISHFRNATFTIGNHLYNGLSVIFRLLTFNELKLLDRFLPDDRDERENAGLITAELEEDIFKKCVYHIFGLDSDVKIDLDKTEAGFISAVAGLILKRSYQHVGDPLAAVSNYMGTVNLIDSIRLAVSRYYSTPIKEVDDLPIDVLFRRFAVFQTTFPQEALKTQEDKETKSK